MKLLSFAFGMLAALAASAQEFPNRPIKLVVPYSAGGLPDTMARLVGQKVSDSLGQQVIVENRGGAGGISGSEAVAKAPADGYTLLIADVGQVAINPHLFSKLPYDPAKDFVPVSLLGTSALFLVVHPSVEVNSFQELVVLVKANPGKYNFGSSGTGSIHHLAIEAFKTSLDLNMVHVPYKGVGQALPALLGGQVSMIFAALPAIESHVKSGKLKLLAVSTATRSARAPDVPTFVELGIAGYEFVPEIGVVAPAGTPAPVLQKLAGELAKAVRQPDVVQRFTQLGIDPVGSTPEAYAAVIRASYEKYGKVVKASGAKVE
ncbi:MAG TPA: tripartite tricarboxylate transporter substrate binding protein [Burkholderiales bacterium]|nr:tripartite tricarboxylate transporter substrate binding protein [Burkholderiales bacterium]